VVILRLPADESLVRPRSRCPRCGHQLAWYENVPVLSWLGLRGRCSSCRAPISAQYPLVELLTGVLFLACLSRFGWSLSLAIALTFVTVLLPLVFIDARHWVLPDELTAPGIAALLALQLLGGLSAFTTALIGAAVAFLVFRVMELLGWAMMGREALGAGDKNLMAMVGAALGWRPLLGVILLSSLQGATYGLSRRRAGAFDGRLRGAAAGARRRRARSAGGVSELGARALDPRVPPPRPPRLAPAAAPPLLAPHPGHPRSAAAGRGWGRAGVDAQRQQHAVRPVDRPRRSRGAPPGALADRGPRRDPLGALGGTPLRTLKWGTAVFFFQPSAKR